MDLPEPDFVAEGLTLYCADCRDVLPFIEKADALITDPPYGIKESRNRNASRSKIGTAIGSVAGRVVQARDYGDLDWDNEPLDSETMALIQKSARWNIIFGGNFYNLPPSRCWLVWDKLNGNSDFADCELAWTNLDKAVRRIQHLWNGFIRAHGEPRGFHPTQKPLGVMQWSISQLPEDCETIIDPLMGSGTTGLAALSMGKRFIGIERERRYFETARERFSEALVQGALWHPNPQPIQRGARPAPPSTTEAENE